MVNNSFLNQLSNMEEELKRVIEEEEFRANAWKNESPKITEFFLKSAEKNQ